MAEQGQVVEQPDILTRLSNLENPEPEETSEPEADEPEAQGESTAEGEEEGQEAEPSVEVDPDVPLVEITVKGEDGSDETRLWSLNEMRKGVMMERDYQNKSKALSKVRETIDHEVQSQITEARNQYVAGLKTAEQTLLALVVPELNNVDFEKLASENPAQAVQLQARAQKLNNAVQNIRQQLAQAEQQALQKMAQQSVKALSDPITGIPGWGDELYSNVITEGAKFFGFRPEEVAAVVDHRMIRALHAAVQFERAKRTKPTPKAGSPKVIKPGAPQGKDDLRAREVINLRQRLKKSGDIKDAAAAWLAQQGRE